MEWAALVAWIATAGGGFVMLAIWLSRGGMNQAREGGSRSRAPLIPRHSLLGGARLDDVRDLVPAAPARPDGGDRCHRRAGLVGHPARTAFSRVDRGGATI